MESKIEYSGIFIHPKYFKYHGPAEKSGNSLFICLNCPSKKNNSGSLRTYSNNDKSRQNLYKHMQSELHGFLVSFKSDSHQGTKSGCKRKLFAAAVERIFGFGGRVLTPKRTDDILILMIILNS
jgi:hypothetical protein